MSNLNKISGNQSVFLSTTFV